MTQDEQGRIHLTSQSGDLGEAQITEIARSLMIANVLFSALHPEVRDLETVFKEINNQGVSPCSLKAALLCLARKEIAQFFSSPVAFVFLGTFWPSACFRFSGLMLFRPQHCRRSPCFQSMPCF